MRRKNRKVEPGPEFNADSNKLIISKKKKRNIYRKYENYNNFFNKINFS